CHTVPQWITERLSVHARFMKVKTEGRGAKKRRVPVQMSPPTWIAAHVLARGTWPGFKALENVATSPTMRRDGSVIQEAGYDAPSGILYLPRAAYRRVPDKPSQAEALEARDRLLD